MTAKRLSAEELDGALARSSQHGWHSDLELQLLDAP
jgi:hypothetical protein